MLSLYSGYWKQTWQCLVSYKVVSSRLFKKSGTLLYNKIETNVKISWELGAPYMQESETGSVHNKCFLLLAFTKCCKPHLKVHVCICFNPLGSITQINSIYIYTHDIYLFTNCQIMQNSNLYLLCYQKWVYLELQH